MNVVRDPTSSGQLDKFIVRNTPHTFGIGGLQRLAEEMTIGDVTAIALYMAGQPRPTTRLELVELGLIDDLEPGEAEAIDRGGKVFETVGYASCHKPELAVDNSIFSDASQNASVGMKSSQVFRVLKRRASIRPIRSPSI